MTHELRPKRRGPAASVVTDPLERIVWAASPVYVRRAVYLVLAGDVVLILAYVGLNLIGFEFRKLDLDDENNIPTWYSSAKLLAIAASLAVVALLVVARDKLTRMVLLAPVALFMFLSLDEVASIHESLGFLIDRALTGAEREDLLFDQTGYWRSASPIIASCAPPGRSCGWRHWARVCSCPARSWSRLEEMPSSSIWRSCCRRHSRREWNCSAPPSSWPQL